MKISAKIKMVLVVAISAMFANNAQAQEVKEVKNYDQGFRLGVGLNAGYSTNDPYKLALGADVRGQYDLSKRYSLTLTTGYTNLFVSKADTFPGQTEGKDLGIIPAKAGFKAFVWNDEFYVMGEAGAAFAVSNVDNTRDKTSLLLSPSIGYATKYIDISLNYTHYNHFDRLNNNGTLGRGVGQVGVRLAYGFQL
ncbi:hypothetical protein H4V97_002733 [Flavobacterium sp. CG_23.5]|uniref:hypothetical protein n=1 Tax=unclassified Flavobacterium TaxID=196869 RepID=UPI0018C91944|nr:MULTISPECIES: hypothetical protein [unclassified Flavobacterium]MBG6111210.1 hypothetical protein [Flavobacterium sp. CG_9.10]MBP2284415.1 hypothetical protein [Flavobacterium sp. CG_23.5]